MFSLNTGTKFGVLVFIISKGVEGKQNYSHVGGKF